MRLTLAITTLGAGGAERVLSAMANYWTSAGHEVSLITFSRASADFYPLAPAVQRNGLDLITDSTHPVAALWHNIRRVRRLRQALSESRPDVIVSFIDKMNVLVLLAGRGLGVPIVVSERIDPRHHAIGKLWSTLRRLVYPGASAVVVQSEAVQRWAGTLVRPNIVTVIPNPVYAPNPSQPGDTAEASDENGTDAEASQPNTALVGDPALSAEVSSESAQPSPRNGAHVENYVLSADASIERTHPSPPGAALVGDAALSAEVSIELAQAVSAIAASAGRPDRSFGRPLVVAMGRLDPQKGFDLLLHSFAECASKHPEWSLVILGEGGERGRLESLQTTLGLTGRVQFCGRVRHPERILLRADLFVLSSRYEGFPNALLEAMACGLPVVSFDCSSGPRDIVRNEIDGLLVPSEDVSALAAAMDRLMSDPTERRRLAARAVEIAVRLHPDRIMAMWDHLLARLSSGQPDSPPAVP